MRLDYKVSYREKDKSIQCIIAYKDGDKWKTKSKQGFKTQKESKPWQDETIKKIKKELKNSSKLNAEYQGITFEKFKDVYLKELALYREPNTITAYEIAFLRFGDLNDRTLTNITFLDIKSIVNDMLKEGLNTETIRFYIKRLNVCLNAAVDDYKAIAENPLKENKIKLPKSKERKQIKTLTKSESKKLIEVINPEKDKMITLIALKCGLRAGEITGLTWDCINFKSMDLMVEKQWKKLKSGEYGFGSLKSPNSYRKVPIPPDLIEELEKYKKVCIREFKYDRLFIEKTTTNVCSRLYSKYKRLGFDISIHDLRHTYATNLIAIGLDFKTIAEYMGDTVEVVINTYAHFNDDMYLAGKDRINNFL